MAVAAELARRGCGVAWPVGDNESYDLIVTGESGKLYRTQVKSASQNKHGSYKIPFTYGRGVKTMYTKQDIDMLVARLPYNEDYKEVARAGYYILPIADIKVGKGTFYPPGKGRHPQWVCQYEKYRDNWGAFK